MEIICVSNDGQPLLEVGKIYTRENIDFKQETLDVYISRKGTCNFPIKCFSVWFNDFTDLVGKTISEVIHLEDSDDGEKLIFKTACGKEYQQYHLQDCCEQVWVESIDGDLEDIIGINILTAEEVLGESAVDNYGSTTWTFYKIDSLRGGVTIRWCGSSNGYYSEGVYFTRVK